ncbi:hypothetical protein KUCAC02_019640 [Chaenocephalus aceratus]|uniref:Uncharacterized protein n=1 Tax=Chaenocephalus aceratus TaxID=36190 RepID=A0ACB9VPE2_CHAAC|nr:hypothetical protein KUCAC02_019640 [Chaenocephalus aceratus]
MWYRSELEDGYESNKTGSSGGGSPGWVPGSGVCGARRHSTVSDSGDTGIGTYCSNSVEDDSSSSTTPLSLQPLTLQHLVSQDEGSVPLVHVMLSPSSSPYTGYSTPASTSSSTGRWSRSCQLLTPGVTLPGVSLDMKDHQPLRRCSSLTKLPSGADRSSSRTSGLQYNPQGSLDRGLPHGYRKEPLGSNVDLYLPLSSSLLYNSLLQRSPGAGPCYRYNHSSRSSGLEKNRSVPSSPSSSVKRNSLDMNYSALPESKVARGGAQLYGLSLPKPADPALKDHQTDRGSPIQPAVRTQMWLAEQMEYRPKVEGGGQLGPIGAAGTEGCGDGPSPCQQEPGLHQVLMGTSLPVHTLVKVKEGLLRQRELEIERQKQQILQLHARIRENELRAEQVLHSQRVWLDDPPFQKPSDRLYCDEELGRKLAVAELEVLHLSEFFKQVNHKYTEDIRKLEEKIKTRDRYISSLKKKCQRESEQIREKKQRIETLEKYLSDLPTLDEEEVQQKAKHLERTASRLQQSLEEGYALMKEKDFRMEMQAMREKELIASVQSLQQKVQLCLADGVRLPMQDLKRLEVENTDLLEQKYHSSRVGDSGLLVELPEVELPEVGRLLKEMSLCLLDLQALCSILAQRAQGKEPNLSLLLGMKSLSVSAEESDSREEVEEELRGKLLEVARLRGDIDDLWRSISERYAQGQGDSCVS